MKFSLWILVSDKELEELLLVDTNTVAYFPVSCQEYADNGASQNGSYRVQPNSNIPRKYIINLLHKFDIFQSGKLLSITIIQYKCKSKVFQSIVSLMLIRDLVYSIQLFLNQHKSLQLLTWMMDVSNLVVTKIMWLIARVIKLSNICFIQYK